MKTYIPELSEQRMVRRAPNRPIDFGPDRDYIFACLHDVEVSFGLRGFPGLAPEQIPARALIRQFIVWWRTLEPANAAQQAAYARLPGDHQAHRYHFQLVGGACLRNAGLAVD